MHKSHIHVLDICFTSRHASVWSFWGPAWKVETSGQLGVSLCRRVGGDPLRSEASPQQEVMLGHLRPCSPSISVSPASPCPAAPRTWRRQTNTRLPPSGTLAPPPPRSDTPPKSNKRSQHPMALNTALSPARKPSRLAWGDDVT